jgi:hypothetical protein
MEAWAVYHPTPHPTLESGWEMACTAAMEIPCMAEWEVRCMVATAVMEEWEGWGMEGWDTVEWVILMILLV